MDPEFARRGAGALLFGISILVAVLTTGKRPYPKKALIWGMAIGLVVAGA